MGRLVSRQEAQRTAHAALAVVSIAGKGKTKQLADRAAVWLQYSKDIELVLKNDTAENVTIPDLPEGAKK